MNRRLIVISVAAATAAAGLVPAVAGQATTAKPVKGSFSYTDVTPDSTPDAGSNASLHCHGKLPAAPVDVNSHPLKLGARGTLSVLGHTTGDWAMEIRDATGNVIAGSDGGTPTDQEGAVVTIPRAGTYQVVYCNLAGVPTATADYSFKPR